MLGMKIASYHCVKLKDRRRSNNEKIKFEKGYHNKTR